MTVRNIVIIVWDDIGVDQFDLYHPELAAAGPTPYFNIRANSGVRFLKNTANPICSPTRASILTGLSPNRHGVGFVTGVLSGLPTTFQMLPKVLQARGYRTAAVGKWHLTDLDEGHSDHPIRCGFQSWEGIQANPTTYTSGAYTWHTQSGLGTSNHSHSTPASYLTTYTADAAISKISGSEPFFLYVAFNAVHDPFHCPPSSLHSFGPVCGTGTTLENYRAMKEALDRETERFVSSLDLTDTLVFIVGDNGTPDTVVAGYPVAQAKGSTFLGGVRTPLIAFGAGTSPRVSSQLVQVSDFPATILDVLGFESDFPEAVDSISFASELTDSWHEVPITKRTFSYSEAFIPNGLPFSPTTWNRGAEDDIYHLVLNNGGGQKFFDVNRDPLELSPLNFYFLNDQQREAYNNLFSIIEDLGLVSTYSWAEFYIRQSTDWAFYITERAETIWAEDDYFYVPDHPWGGELPKFYFDGEWLLPLDTDFDHVKGTGNPEELVVKPEDFSIVPEQIQFRRGEWSQQENETTPWTKRNN